MKNVAADDIRRHKDGSIDYTYYTKIGRFERSRQTYSNMNALSKFLRSIFSFLSKREAKMNIVPENNVENTVHKFNVQSLSGRDRKNAA